MSQPLPHANFEWIEDISSFDINSPNPAKGYILEVDLEYPESLHDKHIDLPFFPEHAKPPSKKQEKLLATVSDKDRYVIYYRTLQHCLQHGLKLKKIHRVLQFDASPWLAKYIDLNTQLRTNATNDFEKTMYKLMNNAVYGKTMEDVRARRNVKTVTEWDSRYGAESLISKPNFHSRSIFAKNLIAVELRNLQVKMDKPIVTV